MLTNISQFSPKKKKRTQLLCSFSFFIYSFIFFYFLHKFFIFSISSATVSRALSSMTIKESSSDQCLHRRNSLSEQNGRRNNPTHQFKLGTSHHSIPVVHDHRTESLGLLLSALTQNFSKLNCWYIIIEVEAQVFLKKLMIETRVWVVSIHVATEMNEGSNLSNHTRELIFFFTSTTTVLRNQYYR